MLELAIEGNRPGTLNYEARKLVNAGRSGRDASKVLKHMEELRKTGISVSEEYPIFWPKTGDRLTTGQRIEVLPGTKSSGEVEYVILMHEDGPFVSVGSDHTDRELQKTSLVAAKQICQNVMAPVVWRYDEVRDGWDDIIMRSWVEEDGERQLYQEGKLVDILSPEQILEEVKSRIDGDLTGTVVFSGTFPTVSGELSYSSKFEMELLNERTGRAIRHMYTIEPITWFKKKA